MVLEEQIFKDEFPELVRYWVFRNWFSNLIRFKGTIKSIVVGKEDTACCP